MSPCVSGVLWRCVFDTLVSKSRLRRRLGIQSCVERLAPPHWFRLSSGPSLASLVPPLTLSRGVRGEKFLVLLLAFLLDS
jgi:hypothetical protein